jgi:hypothetical protein
MTTVLDPTVVAAGTTFLDLVNRARRECGVSSEALTSLQGSLSNESMRFKDWVSDGWRDLQLARTAWRWMRITGAFDTVAGTWEYGAEAAGILDLGDWIQDTFRLYKTADGTDDEMYLSDMDWGRFRNDFRFGTSRNLQSRPIAVSVQPNRSLALGPVPDDVYTVTFEYQRAPSELVEDADDPCSSTNGLPRRFYMLVVYQAMKAYAHFESAPEVLMRAEKGYSVLLNQLMLYSGAPKV